MNFLYNHLSTQNLEPNPVILMSNLLNDFISPLLDMPHRFRRTILPSSNSKNKHSALLIQTLLSNDAGLHLSHYQFWADLLRIPTNIDYTLYYREWIKEEIRSNTPFDELAHKLVSGHGPDF